MFGLDSTQGYLEFADYYPDGGSSVVFSKSDENNFSTHMYKLKQLESEGYLTIEWTPYESEKEGMVTINQICLTTSGKELLDKLHKSSKIGHLKSKIINLVWVVLTSIVTTLVVLEIKG